MSHKKSEKILHDNVIKSLVENGWEVLKVKNLQELEQNFINIVNLRNKEKLAINDKDKLSSSEVERLMNKIKNNSSISDYAKFLLDDSCSIKLDNGKDIYLNLFNKTKWCSNEFQLVSEFTNSQTSVKNNRYDILLLINGFPLANIELKHSGVILNKAFEQTKRYHNELVGLLKFIQIYVISNQIHTKYYANNNQINSKFAFTWVDEDNNIVDNIFEFINQFLEKCNFSEYISRYIINQDKKNILIALRGYQVHGVKKIIEHVNTSKDNGYIWHTTGSGKTITSFKTAQIITRDCKDVAKVVFLVDRTDLDLQTYNEYNSFLKEHEKLDKTENTKTLKKQLISGNNKLIISTIQKMNNLLKNNLDSIKNIKNEKIVFIIDECHRSTFGEMYSRIKDFFNNAQYIGFTGTPIFEHDNLKKKDQITNKVFHKCLHKYLIKNAINDNNVLPFQIDYYEFNKEVSTDYKENITSLVKSDNFINFVIKDIINFHDQKTNNREFFGIVTFANIQALVKAYDFMKKIQEEKKKLNPNFKVLKVSSIFSTHENENEHKYENQVKLKEMILDFNKYTNSNEDISDISKYENRLQSVIKNEKVVELDLIFVVDKLLTGFDAKLLNTIYIAKNMKRHNLIQAMSRTNRVFNYNKKNGMVVSYVPGLKNQVDEAVKVYSSSKNANSFSSKPYNELIEAARSCYASLKNIDISNALEDPLNNIKTINSYRKGAKDLQDAFDEIKTYREFKSKDIGRDENGYEFSIDKLKEIVNISYEMDRKIKDILEDKDLSLQDKDKLEDAQNSAQMPLIWVDKNTINHIYIMKLISSAQESGDINSIKKRQQEAIYHVNTDEKLQKTFLSEFFKNFKHNEDIFEQLKNYRQNLELKIKNNFEVDENFIETQIHNINIKDAYKISTDEKIKKYLLQKGHKIHERKKINEELNKTFYTICALNKIIDVEL